MINGDLDTRRGGFREMLDGMVHLKRTRAKSWLPFVSATLFLCFFVSCTEDNPPEPPAPSMTILEAPAYLAANFDSCYAYRVQLVNVDADSVTVEVRAPNGDLHSTFALYDDGGVGSGQPAYACAGSGDIVPNDHQYTRRINGRLLADTTNPVTGTYEFRFRAPEVQERTRDVHIESVAECLITSWPQVHALDSCFDTLDFDVHVLPSEADAVDSVLVSLETLEVPVELTRAYFSPAEGDTAWRLTFTPQFFKCIGGGAYSLTFHAKTRFGMECAEWTMPVTYTNDLPVLSGSTLPDTAYRPPVDSTLIVVTVHLEDCELQGATDFFGRNDAPGVKFDVYRDPNPWGHLGDYFLHDDGGAPDLHAGDGTYSSWLKIIPDSVLTNNMYYFRFYAVECAAPFDTSEFLLDSIRIIQPSGALLNKPNVRAVAGSHYPVLN